MDLRNLRCSGEKDSHGHFQWVLKDEVAGALEELGLVKPIVVDDIFADIQARETELNAVPEKFRNAAIQARIGQGIFRERLIKHWEGCSITGYDNTDLLIASHIKPWRDCTPYEAVDMTNGLLLVPNLDLAFDRGFISFQDNGSIIFSPHFGEEDAKALGISSTMKLRWCHAEHAVFLEYHRNSVLRTDA